jgi:SMI1 / KNR4 family (SUKH-1)
MNESPESTPVWLLELEKNLIEYGDRLGSRISPGENPIRFFARTKFWMHSVFPALNSEELNQFQTQLGFELPQEIRDFLLWGNGMTLFDHSMTLCGFMCKRFGEFSVGLGFRDFIYMTQEGKMLGAPEHFFTIGYLVWNADKLSPLIYDVENNIYGHCNDKLGSDWTLRQTWPSFSEMLLSEFKRMDTGHDREGKRTYRFEDER